MIRVISNDQYINDSFTMLFLAMVLTFISSHFNKLEVTFISRLLYIRQDLVFSVKLQFGKTLVSVQKTLHF